MPALAPSTAVRWLLAPATSAPPRGNAIALAALRILLGLLWLYNVSWKRPPDFGRSSGSGLYGFTKDAVDHPVFPPYSWVVETFVLPNFVAFGWMVLVVETLLAVLLLTGTLVRVAALVGVGQSLAIGLSVAQTPGEWPWSYWLMIGAHVVLVLCASGAVLAVDGARAHRRTDAVTTAPARLVQLWALVVAGAGVVALLLSIGASPLAARGEALGGSGLSISLGRYNLVGAIVLLVIAALMFAAASLGRSALATAAAAISVLAALSLYLQLQRTDPWLGGNNTSAAFFLCAALISAMLAGGLDRKTSEREVHANG